MKEILIISLLGIAILAIDLVRLRKLALPITIAGLCGLIASAILDWGQNEVPFAQYGGMLRFDNYALAFTITFAFVAALWFLMNSDYYAAGSSKRTDIFALSIFSLCGAVVLSSYSSLVMLFLGVEILSIPLYVLAASDRKNQLSNEAGFKYFFLGSLASATLLFGIALIYGAFGSFDLAVIHEKISRMSEVSGLALIGIILMLSGFLFKVSVAPFHMWAPDVYQGAPTPVTAFMSTIVKGAAFAGLFRLVSLAISPLPDMVIAALTLMAAITLVVSNLVASTQTNTKRLLAYSSISHAGFMLGFILLAQSANAKYLMYYVLTYSIASLTAFSVVQHVSSYQNKDESFDAFRGLVKRNPLMAGAMTLALLSMAGIPPLGGFLAKYYVISDLISSHIALVIVMILTSAVGAYYYLRIIIAMFTPIENAGRMVVGGTQKMVYAVCTALMVVLFFTASLLELIRF